MTHSSNSNDIINEAKKTDQPTYTIRQISNLYKLPASTLRYYEDLGLLTDVVHTASGARIYNQSHIDRLGGIMCFKRTGLSIAKIRQFYLYEEHMEDHAHDISQMMIDHEQDILNQIEELQNDLVHIREKVRYYAAVEDAIKKVSQFLNGTNFLPTRGIRMKTMATKTNKSLLLTLFDFLYCHSFFVPSILPNQ